MCSAGMRAYLTNGQGPSITIMPSKFTLHNHHKLCPLILLCFSNWHLVWNLDWKLSSRCKCWNQIAVSSEIGARRGWKVFSVWLWELSTQNWETFGPGNWQWLNFWGNNETNVIRFASMITFPSYAHFRHLLQYLTINFCWAIVICFQIRYLFLELSYFYHWCM